MGDIGWGGLLDPTDSLLNSAIRGTIVYLALFAALRMMNNRRSGSVGISDLLLVTPCHPDEQRRPEQHGGRGPTLTEGGVVAGAIFFRSEEHTSELQSRQ